MKKILTLGGLGCGGLIILFIIIGIVVGISGGGGTGLPSLGEQVVTAEEYQRIQNGMSYQEVVAIIGSPGEEMGQNKIDGIPGVMDATTTIMYLWTNNNASSMNAMFQNDSLMQKAQFGLK
jgi:hypothetical protein